MSSLETRKIEPQSGTTVTLGEAGDTVVAPDGTTVKTNTVKDAGGNTLWTSDGAGTYSSINSAVEGSMVFITSQETGTSSSVTFTTGIDSTYDEYVFHWINIHPGGDGRRFRFQCNQAGQYAGGFNETMTTTFFDAENDEAAGGGTIGYKASNDQAQGTAFQDLTREIGGDDNQTSSGELHLFAPSSQAYVKHFYARSISSYHADYIMDNYVAGYINEVSPITEVQFNLESGNFGSGTIALYGIK